MRILLFEDDPASIESAKIQFAGHDLTIVTSCYGLIGLRNPIVSTYTELEFDLVLTDMNVRMTADEREYEQNHGYGPCKKFEPETLFPAGLALALRARDSGIRCLLLTDANGHGDLMGLMLDETKLYWSRPENQRLLRIQTGPARIPTPAGEGKDWLRSIPRDWLNL